MQQSHQLSLSAAILININIMLGAGIFINTVELSKRAGSLGGFAYLMIGIFLLPLVISIAQLVALYPSGGFYTFAQKEISTWAGFISAWSYFVGKLASATLMIHASISLLQQIIPALSYISTLLCDMIILTLFILLNMLNIKTGSYIQGFFMALKSLPITFAIVTTAFLLGGGTVTPVHLLWSGLPSSLPLVLYAATGFEASCSLSSKIKDAHKNAPYAIFISYAIVIFIAFLYQTLFYASIGSLLTTTSSYLYAFPTLTATLLPLAPSLAAFINTFLHLAIASSALGGAYGIIFSNTWNLYALAQHHHVFFAHYFTRLNKHFIPIACVLTEGAICLLYLFITRGTTVVLQQVAALGCVLAYTLSVIALYRARTFGYIINTSSIIPFFGLISCILLITACINNLLHTGFIAFVAFCGLLLAGFLMFFITNKKYIAPAQEKHHTK